MKQWNEYIINIKIYNNKTKEIREEKILTLEHDFYGAENSIKIDNDNILITCYSGIFLYKLKNKKISDNIKSINSNFILGNCGLRAKPDVVCTKDGNILIFGLQYYNKNDIDKTRNYVFQYDSNKNAILPVGKLQEERIGNIFIFFFICLNELFNKSIFLINICHRLLVTIVINIFEFSMCTLR